MIDAGTPAVAVTPADVVGLDHAMAAGSAEP